MVSANASISLGQAAPYASETDAGIRALVPVFRTLVGDTWPQLPRWAQSLMDIGATVAARPVGEAPVVVALALPVRAYAAVLVGAGCVLAATRLRAAASKASDDIARVRTLQPGVPVEFMRGDKLQAATFEGSAARSGETFFKVSYLDRDGGRVTHMVAEHEAWRISVRIDDQSNQHRQSGRRTALPHGTFLSAALGPAGFTQLSRHSSLECILVGRQNVLRAEAMEFSLAVHVSERKIAVAHLDDLLRVRRWIGKGGRYATDAVSATGPSGRQKTNERQQPAPGVVVFDGAIGFLKWRHIWPDSAWIVLLDRTEPHCADGAAAVNALYAQVGQLCTLDVLSDHHLSLFDALAFTRQRS